MGNNPEAVKDKAIKGFSFLIGREALMKILAIVGQLVLVRILAPEIFGIFALVSFVINVAELFTDLGLSMIIVQKTDLKKTIISSIHYLKIVLSSIVVLILILFTEQLTFLYSSFGDQEFLLVKIVSIVLIIKSLRAVPIALLEKDLKYSTISTIDLLGMGVFYISSIFFSLLSFGIWSFIWALLLKELSETLLVYLKSKWLPGKTSKINELIPFVRQGLYFQLSSITGFIHRATIPLVAGVLSTPYHVGLLDWSSNAASIPRTLAENVGRVSFASFSKIQNEKKMISKYVDKSFVFLSFFSCYFVIATFSFGNEVILTLLTDRWLPALPALCLFVTSAFFMNGTGLLGNLVFALGKTRLMFYSSLFFVGLEYSLSLIFFRIFGFTGIASANLISIVVMFVYLIVVINNLGIKINFTKHFLKIVLIAIFVILFSKSLDPYVGFGIFPLLFKAAITLSLYLLLSKIFLKEVLANFTGVVISSLKK